MSGPKFNKVEFEKAQERLLKKKMIDEARDLKIKLTELRCYKDEILKEKAEKANELNQFKGSTIKIGVLRSKIIQLQEFYDTYDNKVEAMIRIRDAETSQDVALQLEELKTAYKKALDEFMVRSTQKKNQVKKFIQKQQRLKEEELKGTSIVYSMNSEIIKEITFEEKMSRQRKSKKKEADINAILLRIEELLSKVDTSEAKRALKHLKRVFTGDTSQRTCDAQYEQAVSVCDYIEKNVERTFDAYDDYQSKIMLYNTDQIRTLKQPLLPISEFVDYKQLEDKIKQLDDLLFEKEAKRYIKAQMDEVFEVLGMHVGESLEFSNTTSGDHYLFTNTENESGYHVHLSKNNGVMIEVVGVQEGDELSIEEDLEVEDSLIRQKEFCEQHPMIVSELRKRGIILTVLKDQPVDEKYARTIVIKNDKETFIDNEANKEREMTYENV